MNRAYNKGTRPKNVKKVSNFEDHTYNFYSDKTLYSYNMRFHATRLFLHKSELFGKISILDIDY